MFVERNQLLRLETFPQHPLVVDGPGLVVGTKVAHTGLEIANGGNYLVGVVQTWGFEVHQEI
jgi:hypothetical protein